MTRRGRDIAVVVGGLLAGIALTAGLQRIGDGATAQPSAPRTRPVPASAAGASTPPVDAPPGTPAPDPRAAVEAFLEAETGLDFDRSFGLLTAAQRGRYGSAASWGAAHAYFLPIRGFALTGQPRSNAGQVFITADMRYEPTLDEVVGLVPARAEAHWLAVPEANGWVVDFDGTEVTPQFPPEIDAVTAARAWLDDARACVPSPAGQFAGGLTGPASILTRLCATPPDDTVPATAPRRLEPAEAPALSAAFGDAGWARGIDVDGPVPFTVLLAPVADEWVVVGVVDR